MHCARSRQCSRPAVCLSPIRCKNIGSCLTEEPCTGCLGHPFKTRYIEGAKDSLRLFANTGGGPAIDGGGECELLSHALDRPLDSPSAWFLRSSPFSSFQPTRFRMALHLFVFWLVVCLLLALALLWCLDRLPDRAFLPERRCQAQLTPPSAETPHPRRLPLYWLRAPCHACMDYEHHHVEVQSTS